MSVEAHAFLGDLGFQPVDRPQITHRRAMSVETPQIQNVASILSALSVARGTNQPNPSSSDIERIAKRVRSKLAIRSHLIQREVRVNGQWNPLQMIRSRASNKFPSPRFLWDVSNEEIFHDIRWREAEHYVVPSIKIDEESDMCSMQGSVGDSASAGGLEPAAAEEALSSCPSQVSLLKPSSGPYNHNSPSRECSSQFLISRLQSKHDSSSEDDRDMPSWYVPEMVFPSEGSQNSSTSEHKASASDMFDDLELDSPERTDRTLDCAEHELLYITAVLESSLYRQNLKMYASGMPQKQQCAEFTKVLKCNVVPQFLDYLSSVERRALELQREINLKVAAPTDAIKLEADRLICDVNTNLCRNLRDTSAMLSELEQCSRKDALCQLGYAVLEYTVLIILRFIWLVFTALTVGRKVFKPGYSACHWCFKWNQRRNKRS